MFEIRELVKLLEVKNLKMYYEVVGRGWVRAVDDVSFELDRGEGLGIVGESGCGKSSLGMTLLRILPENAKIISGEVYLNGENILAMSEKRFRRKYRWKSISMVFQGAMNALNPLFTVGEQIIETIKIHDKNISDSAALRRAKELLEMVGIDPERVKSYPFELSGGMKQRVVIAMALALNPDILIADEPTTALDVIVQSRILHLLKRLQRELGLSLIFISHDVSVIAQMVDHVAVMYAGKFLEYGRIEDVFLRPRHPYTYFLLRGVPDIKGEPRRLEWIPGTPPNLLNPPIGCRFHPRCPFRTEVCEKEEPKLINTDSNHYVACHRVDELSLQMGEY